jgi:hypothetical protein
VMPFPPGSLEYPASSVRARHHRRLSQAFEFYAEVSAKNRGLANGPEINTFGSLKSGRS